MSKRTIKWFAEHSELREGDVILMIGSPCYLLQEKARMIMNRDVQDPKMLKVFFGDGTRYLFDQEFDQHSASRFLSEGFPYY